MRDGATREMQVQPKKGSILSLTHANSADYLHIRATKRCIPHQKCHAYIQKECRVNHPVQLLLIAIRPRYRVSQRECKIYLLYENSSMPRGPPSRPCPEDPTPPNGVRGSESATLFTATMPTDRARHVRSARPIFSV